MITWNGESTAIRGAEESQDGERADTNGNSETDCEDRIFCTLRPSELLKHLLRGAKCSSPQCKSDQDDSDNERVTLTQEVPKQLSAVNQYDGEINRIHVHNYNENLVYVKAPLPGQNGNMKYIPCEANENVETTLQKASVYLLNEEIQDSVVEFAVSGHNNSTFQDTPLDEDDFSTLECFNTCTDNLVGAQTEFWTKISCQESVDCELTNLQPLIAKTSEVVRKLSSASTRDNLLHSKRTEKDLVRCEVIFGKNISRKRSSGSDSDVDEVTVLVPADPSEWNSKHIRSWLSWCSSKFSLNPEPDPEKFPKTGTELCRLTRTEFEKQAENVKSGITLAKHLAHLKHSVTGRPSSPLSIDYKVFESEEEGEYIVCKTSSQ